MKILVINAGSSSIKFKLYSTQKCKENISGIIDGINQKTTKISAKNTINNRKVETFKKIIDHREAILTALHLLTELGGIATGQEIDLVGHRVVHGGEKYSTPVFINKKIINQLRKLSILAPLHNPPNIEGIISAQKFIPSARHIAIFDTAFHHTIPKHAYKYAISEKFYTKYGLRKYGFHGTSHQYVSQIAAKKLGKKSCNLISCHLGNGNSITAIRNGTSIDTTMGFTPLEGVPMGTRSGDIDPAAVLYLMEKEKLSCEQMGHLLNHESGLLALSQISSDMRYIWQAAQKKNSKALMTIEILCYRLAKYIGAYSALLGQLDGLIFTAGIGENAWYIREKTIKYLKNSTIYLNRRLNKSCNNSHPIEVISKADSPTKVFVIPTNEELEIARQCLKLY